MTTSRRGQISFCQLRKTAFALRQISGDDQQLSFRVDEILLDLERRSDEESNESRIEVCLALLEWQRVSQLETHVQETLAFLADELLASETSVFAKVVIRAFRKDELLQLHSWLMHYLGVIASTALHDLSQKQRRKKRTFDASVPPAAILLHHLSGMEEFVTDVTALESYIRACLDHNIIEVIEEYSRFRSIVTLPTRMQLLHYDAKLQRKQQQLESMYSPHSRRDLLPRNDFGKIILSVRRNHVLEDSLELVMYDAITLSQGIHIHFVDEEGQDAGGLIKEWLLLLLQILAPRVLLSKESDANHYIVQACCLQEEALLLGITLGIALMNDIAIDIPLATYIYRYLLEADGIVTLSDLAEVQPAVARGLEEMLTWPETNFTQRLSTTLCYISDDGIIVPLVEGGDKIAVTLANRDTFADRLCHARLVEERQESIQSVKIGFRRIWCDTHALQLFSALDIGNLIRGQQIEYDVDFLKAHCSVDYQNAKDRLYIDTFWKVLQEMGDVNSIRQLLIFVTANSRLPLCSSKAIFHIAILHGEDFALRLPTASTCANTFFLPVYDSSETLHDRLSTALRIGTHGFGLK